MLKTDEPKKLFKGEKQVNVLKTTSPKDNSVFVLHKKKKKKKMI